MRLPSGTRIVLLALFGFLLLTTEFPDFRRRFNVVKQKMARSGNEIGDAAVGLGGLVDSGEVADVEYSRPSMFVDAQWGYGRRRWGGGWGGGEFLYFTFLKCSYH